MKKILLFGFFLSGIACQAQIKNYSINLSASYPLINSVETSAELTTLPILPSTGYYSSFLNVGHIKESYSSQVGFRIGGQFDYPISEKIFFTSGLAINYLRYQRSVKITHLTPEIEYVNTNLPVVVGSPFGVFFGTIQADANGRTVLTPGVSPTIPEKSEKFGNTTALGIQVPVLIGTSFLKNKLQVRTGALFSYLLRATEVKEKYVVTTNAITTYKDASKEGFNEFQAGAIVQTTYLMGKIGIDLSAQKFFTPIYESSRQSAGKARYGALTLGLSYNF